MFWTFVGITWKKYPNVYCARAIRDYKAKVVRFVLYLLYFTSVYACRTQKRVRLRDTFFKISWWIPTTEAGNVMWMEPFKAKNAFVNVLTCTISSYIVNVFFFFHFCAQMAHSAPKNNPVQVYWKNLSQKFYNSYGYKYTLMLPF